MDGEDDWLVRAADREIAGGNQDADSISFEDSERFEGDSDGDSFGSMSDGLNWDWRDAIVPHEVPHMFKGYGISKNRLGPEQSTSTLRPLKGVSGPSSSLAEIAARKCAKHLAFYQLEHIYCSINMLKRNKSHPYMQDVEHLPVSDTLPDTLFLKIVYHCFPANLDDTRLYSVMASGKSENFNHGTMLYQNGYVSNVVQIGYLISANVQDEVLLGSSKTYSVSIKVDRCRVIFSKCSCEDRCEWCSHVCALINFRLHEPHRVQYRVTIWDAINELDGNKLKKFAQYLINELPREHLPMAQRLLDQLSDPKSEINNSYGAPDPTDGGHEAIAVMSYNEPLLHDMFRRQLQSFCMKQNVALAIDELSTTRHSSSQEFHRHLQPFLSLDPSAMQNFIMMIKSMLQRKDPNAISLIRVATEECIANRLVLLHWYCYKLVQTGRWQMISDDTQPRQLNIGQLCDELVNLWRRIALNPAADRSYREQLFDHLQKYHNLSADRIFKIIKSSCVEESLVGSLMSTIVNQGGQTLSAENARFTIDCFPGFYPAMNVCQAMQSFEIQGISVEPCHAWLKWPEQTVELLPEPTPQSPQRKNSTHKKKKSKRRTGRRGNQGPSRRLQREESSESGQESDQEDNQAVFPAGDVAQVLAASHSPMDPLETRFAQCEAAAVHGYADHAQPMAMDLMKTVLSHVETYNEQNLPCTSWTASQNNFELLHSSTLHRIETLEKTHLISKVLLKNRERSTQSQLFAFLVKILLCCKFPMTSKHAQVKEHYLESELLKILQSIEITETEVALMRECTDRIRDIVECERIPPLGLAKFIFEELTYSNNVTKYEPYRNMGTQPMYRANQPKRGRVPEDDDRALAAAVNSLGVRVPISDLDYPMLSESIRFSKGNLALTLLASFKEDQEKLGIILDRLLDPRIHQLYKKYFCNSLFFLKDACNKRKYFPGQRPHFPYESKRKREEQPEQCPNRKEEEVALKKLMSTSVLNQHKQQESKKSVIHVSKGKRLKTRFLANATDAFSAFMFDLGKKVLSIAGGNPNTIFNHVPGGGIQRNLHICSLLINLYGLGVLNKGKKTNWILRNYSSEVSWIQQQIAEIGQAGYEIIREIYWEFHFTPSEMAQLSEKAIQAGHVDADRQACLLSLAILPYAQMLSVQEIRGAIARCKEHSSDDLDKACDGIIRAHDHTGDISADILFQCAHHYEDLWKEKEKELTLRKTSGQVPQLQHMASYPGAPRVYMNQHPYMRRMVPTHPTSPVFSLMQAPGFPQYPESSSQSQLAPDYSNQAGLHQSHSAPQLCNSGGAAASSRQYVSRLIKAYTAGTHAMGAHMRQYEEAVKQNQQRIPMYKDDMIWFTDFVLHNLGLETSFDFFENAYKAINCPFTLLHIASKCYQINYMYNQQDAPLPTKMNHSTPLLPPEFVHNTVRLSMQQNVSSLQSLLTQPPPKLSMLRQHLTYQLLVNKPFHPVTMDLLEKCYDSFAHAISRRLNFSSFSDMDRMEAEHVFKGFLKLVSMIPHNQSIVEMFMHHARRCKHFRSVLPKKDANSVVHGDPQVRQLLTQFSQSAPPAPFSQHYQNHY